ncbi:MAG: hypothetical protein IJT53_01945 [Prevotella sp.]|nr:hypothetical protein [Prevotella sp.]
MLNNFFIIYYVFVNIYSRCEVRGTRCEVRGARCEVRGARCGVRGTRCEGDV